MTFHLSASRRSRFLLSSIQAKRKFDPNDPRYDAVGSSSLREELFGTYTKTLGGDLSAEKTDKGSDEHEDDELPQQADGAARRKQRAERAERGLREREEKVRR